MLSNIKNIFSNFFAWYKRNEKINLYITAGLFIWQSVHLFWLTTNVVMFKLFGRAFWEVGEAGSLLIAVVDYTEIPALILASLYYINELKQKFSRKSLLLLVLLNTQWIHLFWITDEIVVEQIIGTSLVAMPMWLSWVAILIDYLELPVIYDTVKKSILSLRKNI